MASCRSLPKGCRGNFVGCPGARSRSLSILEGDGPDAEDLPPQVVGIGRSPLSVGCGTRCIEGTIARIGAVVGISIVAGPDHKHSVVGKGKSPCGMMIIIRGARKSKDHLLIGELIIGNGKAAEFHGSIRAILAAWVGVECIKPLVGCELGV